MRWVLVVILFFSISANIFAAEFNAGFVQGLWYSSGTPFAGKPTRMYVAIRNNTGADLTGTVEFYVNDTRIERNNVSALDGRIIESWADWTPSYGEHTIHATFSRIELHQVGSSTEAIEVTSALAKDTLFIEYDTDGDGIGNQEDTDDDGDGISDEQEQSDGTDPLDPEDPKPIIEDEGGVQEQHSGDTNREPSSPASTTETEEGQQEGLEQYLTESPADTVLTSLTNTINSTKKKVDEYRETRSETRSETDETMHEHEGVDAAESRSDSAASTSTSSIHENGFGDVTRTKDDSNVGIIASLVEAIRHSITSLYSVLLFLISSYLGHPVIVQLSLLFLILFLVIKVARRLARRPQ